MILVPRSILVCAAVVLATLGALGAYGAPLFNFWTSISDRRMVRAVAPSARPLEL
jgi:hypothetical protein